MAPLGFHSQPLRVGRYVKVFQLAIVSPSTGDCRYNRTCVCQHMQCVVTTMYTVHLVSHHVTLQRLFLSQYESSASCPRWGACRDKWTNLYLKNMDTKCWPSRYNSVWTCVIIRAQSSLIIINILSSSVWVAELHNLLRQLAHRALLHLNKIKCKKQTKILTSAKSCIHPVVQPYHRYDSK